MRVAYIKNAGHCTRCGEPFGGNATAYMVTEYVVWSFLNEESGLCQHETVAVCDACVTEQELEKVTADAVCEGCGQRMKHHPYLPKSTCSNRCEQRARRKRRRALNTLQAICTICKATFWPERADAKFCSSGCRQKAYRRRRSRDRQPPLNLDRKDTPPTGVT